MSKEKNFTWAKNLLALMRSAGESIISNKATTSSFAKHIREISIAGYDADIHSHFSKFLCENFSPETSDKVRWAGEILVDWIVLNTAMHLTTEKHPYSSWQLSENDFLNALPFQLPVFNLKVQQDTQVDKTFFQLRLGNIEDLILSRKYDDIFNAILLWRIYSKEPFHDYRRALNIRSVDDYINFYLVENINKFDMNVDVCWKVATRFFSKKDNIKKFFQHQKEILRERKQRADRIARETLKIKQQKQEENEKRKKEHTENRRRKLKEPVGGQKERSVVIEMLDKKIETNGTAVGNRAAWLCPCGNKSPLIGRTHSIIPQSKSIVICSKCKKHYHLLPLWGKPNRPPEKIVEIDSNFDFTK